MLESLDGPSVRRWMRSAWRGLGRERAEIDSLNVFPVADGDTGTNLHLTVEAVVATSGSDDLAGEPDAAAALAVMARGALAGARGNSGAILAQLLRGLAAGFGADPGASAGRCLAAGLAAGAEQARAAVGEPVAGTILSVADAAADAARSACVVGADDLTTVAGAAAAAARSALARTPSQLAVLAEAGVVDAGGRGLVVILDALVATVADAVRPGAGGDTDDTESGGDDDSSAAPVLAPPQVRAVPVAADGEPAFEVMYALGADDAAVNVLRARLAELGDSVVVSGGDGVWAVHVHLADAGAALDAGITAGRVSSVRVARSSAPHRRAARWS